MISRSSLLKHCNKSTADLALHIIHHPLSAKYPCELEQSCLFVIHPIGNELSHRDLHELNFSESVQRQMGLTLTCRAFTHSMDTPYDTVAAPGSALRIIASPVPRRKVLHWPYRAFPRRREVEVSSCGDP